MEVYKALEGSRKTPRGPQGPQGGLRNSEAAPGFLFERILKDRVGCPVHLTPELEKPAFVLQTKWFLEQWQENKDNLAAHPLVVKLVEHISTGQQQSKFSLHAWLQAASNTMDAIVCAQTRSTWLKLPKYVHEHKRLPIHCEGIVSCNADIEILMNSRGKLMLEAVLGGEHRIQTHVGPTVRKFVEGCTTKAPQEAQDFLNKLFFVEARIVDADMWVSCWEMMLEAFVAADEQSVTTEMLRRLDRLVAEFNPTGETGIKQEAQGRPPTDSTSQAVEADKTDKKKDGKGVTSELIVHGGANTAKRRTPDNTMLFSAYLESFDLEYSHNGTNMKVPMEVFQNALKELDSLLRKRNNGKNADSGYTQLRHPRVEGLGVAKKKFAPWTVDVMTPNIKFYFYGDITFMPKALAIRITTLFGVPIYMLPCDDVDTGRPDPEQDDLG